MLTLRNQKGMVLVMVYIVSCILMGLSTAFFMRMVQEGKLGQRQNDSLRAFYNAEKAVAYAYFESAEASWNWFTHQQDAQGDIVPVAAPPASRRTAVDANFANTGDDAGCYAANDGSFILKTFPDPRSNRITVVRAKGVSGNVERVIEVRISRDSIFDYAFWTPYSLAFGNIGGGSTGANVFINGGRIHSNGSIYMDSRWKRFYDVDTISTGKNQGIWFSSSPYLPPGYYDYNVDGSRNVNGQIPIPDLGKPNRWAGTTDSDPYATRYPWKYEQLPGVWNWRSIYGGYDAGQYAGTWPPRDWREKNYLFNTYSSWFYPVKKDANGNIVFDAWGRPIRESGQQIPAYLTGAMWDWQKYYDYNPVGGSSQLPVSFVVYDPTTGGTKPVEDTRWKIITNPDFSKSVVMTTLNDPQGVTYWQMLKRYDYWRALGYSDSNARYYSTTGLNSEVLDGTYGSEYALGQRTIQVDNTNSLTQAEAWNEFLRSRGLDDLFLTNERGVNMEAPRFSTSYRDKAKNAGLYLSKSAGTHRLNYGNGNKVEYTVADSEACGPCGKSACSSDINDTNSYKNYLACMESRIDALVDALNRAPDGSELPATQRCAQKKSFINTYTAKWSVVLELDLGKMDSAGLFPANGIIYSEVPIRLTNARKLPYSGEASRSTFNVISEENIYFKGDYNNPAFANQWISSAVISERFIYALSNNFNDPQVTPALVAYPSYPAVYVTKKDIDGDGDIDFIEADPRLGGGSWVNAGTYPTGSQPYNQIIALRDAIQADWSATFNKDDPTGSNTYTVSSTHPIINGQTWGAMPNRVQQDYTYNCLMASYYNYNGGRSWSVSNKQPVGGIPSGSNLERWYDDRGNTRNKILKGSYFQLDWAAETDVTRFTAHKSDGPLDGYFYATANSHGVLSGSANYVASPNTSTSYDSRFRNPLISRNSPIFFGGGGSSWREIPTADF